jgi:RecA-family ATPase
MNKLDVLKQQEWLDETNDDWLDDEELDSDGLPEPVVVGTMLKNLPKLPPELIEGVVRVGHKMMISGASKQVRVFYLWSLRLHYQKVQNG